MRLDARPRSALAQPVMLRDRLRLARLQVGGDEEPGPDADTRIKGLRACDKSWTIPSIDQLKPLFDRNAVAGIRYFTGGLYWPAHISPVFSGIGMGSWVWAQAPHHGVNARAFNINQDVKVEIPSRDFSQSPNPIQS